MGLVDWRLLHGLCRGICEKDVAALLSIVDDIVSGGKDLAQFNQEILRYFRNLLVVKSGAPESLLALPEDQVVELKRSAEQFTLTQLIRLVEQFTELTREFDSQLTQRIALESLLIRLAKQSVDVSIDSVLEKLSLLSEGAGPSAGPTEAPAAKAQTTTPLEKKPVAPKRSASAPAEPKAAAPHGTSGPAPVDPADVEAALKDPHIAEVVDTFKGQIVDIRDDSEARD